MVKFAVDFRDLLKILLHCKDSFLISDIHCVNESLTESKS